MRSSIKIRQLFLVIFIFGFILFNQPILSIFDKKNMIIGMPVMLFYIFLVWGILILLMALISSLYKSKIKNN